MSRGNLCVHLTAFRRLRFTFPALLTKGKSERLNGVTLPFCARRKTQNRFSRQSVCPTNTRHPPPFATKFSGKKRERSSYDGATNPNTKELGLPANGFEETRRTGGVDPVVKPVLLVAPTWRFRSRDPFHVWSKSHLLEKYGLARESYNVATIGVDRSLYGITLTPFWNAIEAIVSFREVYRRSHQGLIPCVGAEAGRYRVR